MLLFKVLLMTEIIKEFIELNIDDIEDADWESVIETFYERFSSPFDTGDEDFKELAEVLQTAGIDFMRLTETTRKEFMSNLVDQILHDELESMSFRGSDEVKKSDILQYIDCDLGFNEQELDKIMEDVAVNSYNLEPDFTCFYVR